MIQSLTSWQIHPLMPLPLMLVAEFLHKNSSRSETFESRLQELLNVFRQLKNINNHKQSYIKLLELSCIFTSSEVAHANAHPTP